MNMSEPKSSTLYRHLIDIIKKKIYSVSVLIFLMVMFFN